MTENKVYMAIFGLLAVLLLPVTALWALFAYLAGDREPLLALRGESDLLNTGGETPRTVSALSGMPRCVLRRGQGSQQPDLEMI